MVINILISTFNNRILGLKKFVKEKDIIYSISHQVTESLSDEAREYIEFLKTQKNVIYSRINSKGVAKNRNNGLKIRVPGSVCFLADDDIEYNYNNLRKIASILDSNQEYDFITFKIKTFDGKDYKRYKNNIFKHNLKTLTNIGIIDVAFKEEVIEKYNLKFDERFGPGSEFPIGEDFIFMTDALKAGANIWFYPLDVVKHGEIGTGSKLKEEIIMGRGAVFARVFGKWCYIINIIFALKHYKNYKKSFSFFEYLKLMIDGCKFFKKKANEIIS